jgi:excisionase family DNA binding protein
VIGDGPWLTVTEVAELLGIHPGTVRNYADAGRLNNPVPMRRLPVRGDRRIHKDSAERLRQELQGN